MQNLRMVRAAYISAEQAEPLSPTSDELMEDPVVIVESPFYGSGGAMTTRLMAMVRPPKPVAASQLHRPPPSDAPLEKPTTTTTPRLPSATSSGMTTWPKQLQTRLFRPAGPLESLERALVAVAALPTEEAVGRASTAAVAY